MILQGTRRTPCSTRARNDMNRKPVAAMQKRASHSRSPAVADASQAIRCRVRQQGTCGANSAEDPVVGRVSTVWQRGGSAFSAIASAHGNRSSGRSSEIIDITISQYEDQPGASGPTKGPERNRHRFSSC